MESKEVLDRLRALPEQLKPRPNSGKLGLDTVFLLLLGALQFSVLPSIFGQYIYLDLLTPWLIITFVQQSYSRAAFLGFVGVSIIETHSAAPAGLYFCAYWIILNVIHQIRDTLSWRHFTPWLTTIVLSQVWVVMFELLIASIIRGTPNLGLSFIAVQLTRIILSIGCGLLICQYWLYLVEEEANA